MAETEADELSSVGFDNPQFRQSTPNAPEKEKAKNFLSYLFSREEPPPQDVTLSQQDQKEIQKSVTQLEAGLGKAGRACVLSFQRWGQDFWNMPEAEIFDGLVKSFWNQILIVVSDRKKRIMELKSHPQAKLNAVNFPPLEEVMVENFRNFQENPDTIACEFVLRYCYEQTDLCFRSLKRERGYFSSIANTIRSAKEGHNSNDWSQMIREADLKQMKIPTRLRSLVLSFMTDPTVEKWSNMINGLVLFKFYSLFRNDNDVQQVWKKVIGARDNLNRNLNDYLLSLEKANIPEYYEDNGKYSNEFINLMNAFTRTGQSASDWFRSLGSVVYSDVVLNDGEQSNPAELLNQAVNATEAPISEDQNNVLNQIIGVGDEQSDEILDIDKPRKKSKKKKKNVEESLSEEVSRACPIDIPGRENFINFGGSLKVSQKIFEELGRQFLTAHRQLSANDEKPVIDAIRDIKYFLGNQKQLSDLVDVLCDIKNMNQGNFRNNLPNFMLRYNRLFNGLSDEPTPMDVDQNEGVMSFEVQQEPSQLTRESEVIQITQPPISQNQKDVNATFQQASDQQDQQLDKRIFIEEQNVQEEAEKQRQEAIGKGEKRTTNESDVGNFEASKRRVTSRSSQVPRAAPPLLQASKQPTKQASKQPTKKASKPPTKQATRASQRKSMPNTQYREFLVTQ